MELIYPPPGKIGIQILNMEIASITLEEVNKIKQFVYDYKLVILRNQNINNLQYLKFAQKIGVSQTYSQDNFHYPEYSQSSGIKFFSNFPKKEKKFGVQKLNKYWYTDGAFLEEPLPFTMLRTKTLPRSTRAIYYIDMQQVYQKLPSRLKKYISDKNLIHEAKWHYKVRESDFGRSLVDILHEIENKLPAVKHPSVMVHPATGAEILYMSSGFTTGIEGVDYKTSQENLKELFSFIERDEHIQPHIWQDGDILLWENRSLNHMISKVVERENTFSYHIGIFDELLFHGLSTKEEKNIRSKTSILKSIF